MGEEGRTDYKNYKDLVERYRELSEFMPDRKGYQGASGRQYGLGRTLEDMIREFDRDRDVRYSGYISELLHVEEVKNRINYVICDKRREIYCDIMPSFNHSNTKEAVCIVKNFHFT